MLRNYKKIFNIQYLIFNIFAMIIVIFFIFSLFFSISVFASTTNGTIDSTYKYAWGSKIGWINFGCDNCGVTITDTAITGYAWSENYGWINLNPGTSGVDNTSEGDLSGNAWGENLGWIDFANVAINSSGQFTGTATGDNVGTLNFDCDNCDVRTDWRPLSIRGSAPAPASTPSSGGSASPMEQTPPLPPFGITINNGSALAGNKIVILNLTAGANVAKMSLSNNPNMAGSSIVSFYPSLEWDICRGITAPVCQGETGEQEFSVYVRFYTANGAPSATFSDSIILKSSLPSTSPLGQGGTATPPSFQEGAGGVAEGTVGVPAPTTKTEPTIFEKITDFIKGVLPGIFLSTPEGEVMPPARLIPLEAPLALRGGWNYIPETPVKEFVFAPLPSELARLAQNFPEMQETFNKLGVKRMTDAVRLEMSGTKFNLPGLSLAVGLKAPKLKVGLQRWPQSVPLVKISPEVKQKVPTEVMFARSGAELIDYNMSLSLTTEGRPEQKIVTVVGKPLHLVIRPKDKVKSVKGYLVFRSKTRPVSAALKLFGIETANAKDLGGVKDFIGSIPMGAALGSLFFDAPTLAVEQKASVRAEERLVLLEFEYTDPDGDGLYTADIESPTVDGDYEIITVMDYEDPSLGVREIRLITVVDPEGYVYEKIGSKEARVPGAVATLYWFNPEQKTYVEWPANEYQQENPQVTDITGKYSFLVPPGGYYLKVEAPGYLPYEGKAFDVEEGRGVHFNIEMKTKYWWLSVLDWRTILLIAVALLLLYNFYKDKRRN